MTFQGPIPKKVQHGRIKPKYNPRQNAAEKRHERYVQAQPCFGCGRWGSSAHHTLLEFEGKHRRRSHDWRLPVCWDCHQGDEGIHGIGSETKWLASVGRTPEEAIALMRRLFEESQ